MYEGLSDHCLYSNLRASRLPDLLPGNWAAARQRERKAA